MNAVEVDDPNIRACVSNHESGQPMICFTPFRISQPTTTTILDLIAKARSTLKPLEIVRICLDADQAALHPLLQELGFRLDGIEYQFSPAALRSGLGANRLGLPASLSVRPMSFEKDIDLVAALEKDIHAADSTSRVNFESPEATAGMRSYYRKACSASGVFVLVDTKDEVLGVVGFMPDRRHEGSTHITSVGLATKAQGSGLFFSFLLEALSQSQFSETTSLVGTTTTGRLIEAAKRYSIRAIGSSWSRLKDPDTKVKEA